MSWVKGVDKVLASIPLKAQYTYQIQQLLARRYTLLDLHISGQMLRLDMEPTLENILGYVTRL